jgi:hypothetical protein
MIKSRRFVSGILEAPNKTSLPAVYHRPDSLSSSVGNVSRINRDALLRLRRWDASADAAQP